jgi:hypothetical protein
VRSTGITPGAYHDSAARVTVLRIGYGDPMAAKRRLPLVSSGAGDADPERAPWQWVGFGTLAIFMVWLPLSAVAVSVAGRMVVRVDSGRAELAPSALPVFVASSALALGIGALAGGLLVGRWGGRRVGVREATLAGLVAALVAVVASWVSAGVSPGALVVVPVAAAFGALGGKLGRSARR